jgi:hypothetical protein
LFEGYPVKNITAVQVVEGVNQCFIQQKWLITMLRTKLMSGIVDVDSNLILKGEIKTFCLSSGKCNQNL